MLLFIRLTDEVHDGQHGFLTAIFKRGVLLDQGGDQAQLVSDGSFIGKPIFRRRS